MKKERLILIFGLSLAIISIVLTLIWYDWKLLLILFLFSWSNNIQGTYNTNKKIKGVFEIIKTIVLQNKKIRL